ncbi:hypothetical protein KKG29_00925 [Patescibacteria group bacterium]|nr:hypothetical protein [Patescibacteria group bacterium]MBU3999728.1 hypothetical protein [Patescibacteria group bacterium]MBU4057115.1 hypothetical protein [Patescibacteria group bacterium]MBU4369017.1 hypothetical protein [Patescibacteria group bacterium]
MKSALNEKIIKDYLESKLKNEVEILEFSFIGEGYYANGYKLVYKIGGETKTDFVRLIKPLNSGHEYPIDRALQMIASKEISDNIANTPKIYDVVGFDEKGEAHSVAKNIEYFSIGEYVDGGKQYTIDLETITQKKKLEPSDISQCLELSNYLAEIHRKKFLSKKESSREKIDLAKSLYKRATREIISSGELTLGVLDFDWEEREWASKKEIYDFVADSLVYREKIKNNYLRLSKVHGDFWDKNILFKNGKMTASDPSRFIWGEPAVDVAAMVARFMNFDLVNFGDLSGLFSKLTKIFMKNYLEKTSDAEILGILPYVFSFNAVVSSHPAFHPELSVENRKLWIKIGRKILESEKFDWGNADKYLK